MIGDDFVVDGVWLEADDLSDRASICAFFELSCDSDGFDSWAFTVSSTIASPSASDARLASNVASTAATFSCAAAAAFFCAAAVAFSCATLRCSAKAFAVL